MTPFEWRKAIITLFLADFCTTETPFTRWFSTRVFDRVMNVFPSRVMAMAMKFLSLS